MQETAHPLIEFVLFVFRQYGDRYELDPLLLMAQGYQESRFGSGGTETVRFPEHGEERLLAGLQLSQELNASFTPRGQRPRTVPLNASRRGHDSSAG